MARNKPTQRKYKQRYSKHNLSPLFAFSDEEIFKMKMTARVALSNFVNDQGTVENWSDLISRLTTGRELAINYFTDDAGRAIHDAVCDATQLFIDYEQSEKWDLKPEWNETISAALDLVDDMHEHLRRRDYYRVFNNAIPFTVQGIIDLKLPWEDYLEQRKTIMKSHGRKVLVA